MTIQVLLLSAVLFACRKGGDILHALGVLLLSAALALYALGRRVRRRLAAAPRVRVALAALGAAEHEIEPLLERALARVPGVGADAVAAALDLVHPVRHAEMRAGSRRAAQIVDENSCLNKTLMYGLKKETRRKKLRKATLPRREMKRRLTYPAGGIC